MPAAGTAATFAHELESHTADAPPLLESEKAMLEHEKEAAKAAEDTPTLAPSGSLLSLNADPEKRSTPTESDNDDKLPSLRKATPPPEPKKRGGFFSKKKEKKEMGEEKDASDFVKPVPFFSLYRYSTKFEIIMNIIGLVLAAAAGAAAPLMTLIFGRLSNTFTGERKPRATADLKSSQRPSISSTTLPTLPTQPSSRSSSSRPSTRSATRRVLMPSTSWRTSQVQYRLLTFPSIGLGMFVCTYIYMLIWNYTSECQGRRIREKYLRAVMRQEVWTRGVMY
jgi:ATP-binding cassette subfamily B (MDR/TAP) protein 1